MSDEMVRIDKLDHMVYRVWDTEQEIFVATNAGRSCWISKGQAGRSIQSKKSFLSGRYVFVECKCDAYMSPVDMLRIL